MPGQILTIHIPHDRVVIQTKWINQGDNHYDH